MNTQLKKGVLELLVLLAVNKKDMYGYELIVEVSKFVDINDGTIYPILKRLTMDKCFETYLIESSEGPPRKYYKITDLGKKKMLELKNNWILFSESVNKFIGGNIDE